MPCIFLSASIPLPDNDARYLDTADIIAIRDSIRALVSVVVPTGQIVFGGHPAITPLIRLIVRGMTPDVNQHITLYQSAHFRRDFPPETAQFERIRIIEAADTGEEESLRLMREAMIGAHNYDAGVFLGGMDGVEREYEIFRRRHPTKPAYPIASTGAAARILFNEYARDQVDLLADLRYLSLFRRLPGVGAP
jgi:SLOG cluster3 family